MCSVLRNDSVSDGSRNLRFGKSVFVADAPVLFRGIVSSLHHTCTTAMVINRESSILLS